MTNKVYPPPPFRGRLLRIRGRDITIWAYINEFFKFLTSAFLTSIREITRTYRHMRVDFRVQRPKIGIWGYLTYQILIGTRVFPGVAKMAIWGLCANPTGVGGGGVLMVKMKSKNTLPPISGSENTNLIVVPPNFDPIYHFLTPPGRRARATKTW